MSRRVDTRKRPRYRIWDTLHQRWWKPTHRAWNGQLEDLALTPGGELVMRTLNAAAIHESVFPDRFVVVPELDLDPCLN